MESGNFSTLFRAREWFSKSLDRANSDSSFLMHYLVDRFILITFGPAGPSAGAARGSTARRTHKSSSGGGKANLIWSTWWNAFIFLLSVCVSAHFTLCSPASTNAACTHLRSHSTASHTAGRTISEMKKVGRSGKEKRRHTGGVTGSFHRARPTLFLHLS